jgi:ubiquinone/menaquinone biosynthesis C-methylase UbiE
MKKIVFLFLLIPFIFSFTEKKQKRFLVRFKDPKELLVFWNDVDKKFTPKKGMKIADVGAGDPSLAFYLLSKYDSISVVAQDIDTTFISSYKIDSIKRLYGKFDKKYLNFNIPFVMGNEHKTNLPKNQFDVVLMTSVHHELIYKDETINDIYEALKNNGKLYVSELTAKRKIKRPECDHYFSIEEELIADYTSRNFILENKIVNHTYKKGKKNQTENCVFIFSKKTK